MLQRVRFERFKSLVSLELELGRINVLIGANGSGKSNILEAIGVLSAAAFGRVDDETLLRRGVRPGVPKLYKTAFPLKKGSPHILFSAQSDKASYDVTLWNPLDKPSPAWRFKTENLKRLSPRKEDVVTRFTTTTERRNQEQGLAALETVRLAADDPALLLMDELRNYSIHCPNTPTLRGLVQDLQSREPVGLAGGRLPEAVEELLNAGPILEDQLADIRSMIEWAHSFSSAPSVDVLLSPSAARSRRVIQFVDRFMAKGRNKLTGYDASEGALYVLYCAVLAMHPRAPQCLALDNVDQALNPRLAQRLMESICRWIRPQDDKQWLVTAHNPAVLDGLPLNDPGVRLFAVDRNTDGHTVARPIDTAKALALRPDKSWTLSRMWMNGLLGGVPNV